jgi:hypothetical protein
MGEKKKFLLRLDGTLFDALNRWAADDLRSINGQIEYILTAAAKQARRLPGKVSGHKERAGEGSDDSP